uniref:G_PROTEIN_RECEP_F1_2 domain-containing protein n=1 Tax=Thelazia callipaeda TaxID=103827 RepID=A0A0N5CTB0_THECL
MTYMMSKISRSARANGCRFFKWNLWVSGIIFKVIPCILLFHFSTVIVIKLHRASRKHKTLLRRSVIVKARDCKKSDRTSNLLLAIVLVFLITELPQGIIAIMNAIYTTHVHIYIYYNLGDILDLLSLLNSSITFVLYCIMSSRYRDTFWTVVLPKHLSRSRRQFFVKDSAKMIAAELNSEQILVKWNHGRHINRSNNGCSNYQFC